MKEISDKRANENIAAITGLISLEHVSGITPEVKEKANAKLIELIDKL